MESRFQTSFVPKQPIAPQTGGTHKNFYTKRSSISIFSSLSGILFVLALIGAAGAFFYQVYLSRHIISLTKDLETIRASLDPVIIAQLQRTDLRIETAKQILGAHTTQSPLFAVLEKETLRNVAFNDFTYDTDNTESASLAMNGEARGFSTIALQADLFSQNSHIVNPMFTDFAREDDGFVSFMFKADLNPQLLAYTVLEAVEPANETESPADIENISNSPAEGATSTPSGSSTSSSL